MKFNMKGALVAMMAVLGLGAASLQAKTEEEVGILPIEESQDIQKTKEARKKAEEIAAQLQEEVAKQMAAENLQEAPIKDVEASK